MNLNIISHLDIKAAEHQKRIEAIKAELQNGTYKNDTIKAEYRVNEVDEKYNSIILTNDIFLDTEKFSTFADLETAAEMVYFFEHVLKSKQ